MPYRDPEARRLARARWRDARTPAYHRWLYDRRALRFENAERFREAMGASLAAPNGVAAALILEAALEDAEMREREVGNRFDHERDEAYFEEGAGPHPGPSPSPPSGEPTTVLTVEWERESGGDWIRRVSRALAARLSEQPEAVEARVQTFATVGLPRATGEPLGQELDEQVVGEAFASDGAVGARAEGAE